MGGVRCGCRRRSLLFSGCLRSDGGGSNHGVNDPITNVCGFELYELVCRKIKVLGLFVDLLDDNVVAHSGLRHSDHVIHYQSLFCLRRWLWGRNIHGDLRIGTRTPDDRKAKPEQDKMTTNDRRGQPERSTAQRGGISHNATNVGVAG